jgi:hypothetical protein
LLAYRFAEREKAGTLGDKHELDVEPRIAQLYAPLLATARGNAPLQARIRASAIRLSERLASERAWSLEAHVVHVLRELLDEESALTVKAIADRFELRFGADYLRTVTPRWIGGVLRRRLGLFPERSRGTFQLATDDLPRIRDLFSRYGLDDEVGENRNA